MATFRPHSQTRQAIQKTIDIDVAPVLAKHSASKKPTYPPLSSVPRTHAHRIAEATPIKSSCPQESIPSTSSIARTLTYEAEPEAAAPATVLYLAYGSNLAAQTFLGQRGIRPLSRINVAAPSLRLTFDLPGFPYREPCFANTAPRRIPKIPDMPPKLPAPPVITPPPARTVAPAADDDDASDDETAYMTSPGDPVWDKGLIGVVYEVTQADYSKIIATEGGGASYQDILVPCLVLPPTIAVPEKPALPPLPRPFLAHTLYAPIVPLPDNGDDTPKPPASRLPKWLQRMVMLKPRPVPDYAQPSERYLNLLRDGARENDLPADYQAYLAALRHYEATTLGQRIARYLVVVLMLPLFLFFIVLRPLITDKNGNNMPAVAPLFSFSFNFVWMVYDNVLFPLFGDGEHTVSKGDGKLTKREREACRQPRWARELHNKPGDAEKRGRSYSKDGQDEL